MDVRPRIGSSEVLTAGTLIAVDNEVAQLAFDTAFFEIVFGESDDGQPFSRFTAINSTRVRYTLFNVRNSLGTAFRLPFGSFDGRKTELRIFVHSIETPDKSSVSRLINYNLIITDEDAK